MDASPSRKPRRDSAAWSSQEGLDVVLRALRLRRKTTQKEVADTAEVSPAAIARIEAGDRRPSHEMLGKLAEAFATTAEGLEEAAAAVARGEDLETALDALPGRRESEPALPSEVAGDYVPSPGTPGGTGPASLPTGDQLQTMALIEQIERLEDREPAVALLRDAVAWLGEHEGRRADVDRLRLELQALLRGPEAGREPVAAMPAGEVRFVFQHAIGKDERGQLWIDPLTRARPAGLEEEDLRVERYDDGTVVVDLPPLAAERCEPRDPDRHRVKARIKSSEASARQEHSLTELEDVYARSLLEIHWSDGSLVTVEPRPIGVVDGEFSEGVDRIHVITAFNPRSRLLRPGENEERNRLLRDDLDRAGLRHTTAVGRSLDGSWREESFAVLDASPELVLDLARRYEQNAIFEWTDQHLAVLWSDGEPGSLRGWSATRQR